MVCGSESDRGDGLPRSRHLVEDGQRGDALGK